MARFRVSIGGLMLAVGLIAADIALFRGLLRLQFRIDVSPPGSTGVRLMDLIGFSMGVVPLINVLVVLTASTIRSIKRSEAGSSFGLGFQLFGWPGLMLFLSWCAIWPRGVYLYVNGLMEPCGDLVARLLGDSVQSLPAWVDFAFEFVLGTPIMSAPAFLIAVCGGFWLRRFGPEVRISAPKITFAPRGPGEVMSSLPKSAIAADFA